MQTVDIVIKNRCTLLVSGFIKRHCTEYIVPIVIVQKLSKYYDYRVPKIMINIIYADTKGIELEIYMKIEKLLHFETLTILYKEIIDPKVKTMYKTADVMRFDTKDYVIGFATINTETFRNLSKGMRYVHIPYHCSIWCRLSDKCNIVLSSETLQINSLPKCAKKLQRKYKFNMFPSQEMDMKSWINADIWSSQSTETASFMIQRLFYYINFKANRFNDMKVTLTDLVHLFDDFKKRSSYYSVHRSYHTILCLLQQSSVIK